MAVNINTAYRKYKENQGTLDSIIDGGEGIIRYYSKIYGGGLDSDDLYQTGVVGLIKAVRTFDPSHGASFSTWACACVISEIRHYVRHETACSRCEDCSDSIEAVTDREWAIAAELQREKSFHLALDDKIMLEQAFSKLKPLQHKVVEALFFKGMTQQQTANELGLTQRKVSRVKCAAIDTLRSLLDVDNFQISSSKNSFKLMKSTK